MSKCQNCFNLPKGESGFRKLFYVYKRQARMRKFNFNLTESEFRELTKINCHYCGAIPSRIFETRNNWGKYVYNGVDRKNSEIGYNSINCVSCCYTCNRAKSDMSYEEYVAHVKQIKSCPNIACLQY